MIDSITVYTAASITTPTTTVSNFLATDISSKTSWAQLTLHVKITNNATDVKQGDTLSLAYAVSTFTVTSTDISKIRPCAKILNIPLPYKGSDITIVVGQTVPASGSTLYTWLLHDEWAQTRTIDAIVAGSP